MPLSDAFLADLQDGHLSSLRSFLLVDRTLSPEIRNNTLTIYYRGGCILKLEATDRGYAASFDRNYAVTGSGPWYEAWAKRTEESPALFNSASDVSEWLAIVPFAKAVMDGWFAVNGGLEREAQQLVVRENNRDGDYARATDYFFCDMERAEGDVVVNDKSRGLRFDLVGVHWPSTRHARMQTKNRSLVIAEAKYGDGAHADKAGLIDHFQGLGCFAANRDRVAATKRAMEESFRQKHSLGFIECQRPLELFAGAEDPIIWLLILIDHDPEKTALRGELQKLAQYVDDAKELPLRVRVATSTFMGYGLWDEGVKDLGDFVNECESQL